MTNTPDPPVLYALCCGSPPTRDVGKLVGLAQGRGWDVCVIGSPSAARWLDIPALEAQTGHPVRVDYKQSDAPDVLPEPDALILAPATVNTINKWAAGISDTLLLGLVAEATGLELPMAAVPFTNWAQAADPALARSVTDLRSWGVNVLFGDDVYAAGPPHR
jgi:phosphopantothenoylcysteine decarboxylase